MGHSSGKGMNVRVAVAGDKGTGKSRLIDAVAGRTFSDEEVLPMLRTAQIPAEQLPTEFCPYRVSTTIVETSSSLENQGKLHDELKLADAVVLTYACDQTETLYRLRDFWLPEFHKLEVNVPIIVAGCKEDTICKVQDVAEHDQINQINQEKEEIIQEHEEINQEQEEILETIMQQFPQVAFCTKCSAQKLRMVDEVFYLAPKAVFYPRAALLDWESQTLRPRCERALKRLFFLFDKDGDGALNNSELNSFHVTCFGMSLQSSEIENVKKVLKIKLSDGVNKLGITLQGFLILHMWFITRWPGQGIETWTALRKYGYGDDLKIRDDLIALPSKRATDQSVEVTEEALVFLKEIFSLFDYDGDGVLHPTELDDIFSTAPESPWDEYPYKDAAEKTVAGGLSLDGFLSMWSLMTLLEPEKSFINLMYVGYLGDPASALRLTRPRRQDRKKQQTERCVFNCFVFGPRGAGKSELLNCFLKRPISERYISTIADRFAANVVDSASKKTLVLREIPEEGVKPLLSQKESLAACDIAVFVHDRSDQESWEKTLDMLNAVVKHGEAGGFEVPCLIVSAKNDCLPFPEAKQDSESVSLNMGIEAPISFMLRGLNDVLFHKILSIAEHPDSSIAHSKAMKSHRKPSKFVNRSLIYVSVGAAVAVVGLAAYRTYAASRMHS